MGRKRITNKKERRVVSVSLPKELVIQWDQHIGPKKTRSRWLQGLLERTIGGTQTALKRTSWICNDCEYAWSWNRSHAFLCTKCKSENISPYILEEE